MPGRGAQARIPNCRPVRVRGREIGQSVTTAYVTYDRVEAMTMGHRVAVLRDCVLQQVDTPRTLYHEPDNLFVAGFIGSPAMNLVPCATGADVEFGGVALRLSDSARGSPGSRAIG